MRYDNSFIEKLIGGSIPCFKKFIETLQTKAQRISYNILRDKDMVEEAIQEGTMKFYEAIRSGRIDRTKNIEAYYLTCVRNATIDLYRKNKLYEEKNFSSLENKDDEESFDVGTGSDFLTNYERMITSHNIWKLLEKIPAKFREVFLMIEYENMSAEEVAEVTKSNINTVRWRLCRAKELMRKLLKEIQTSKLKSKI